MNLRALLSELAAGGVELRSDGDRLHVDAPAGTLTPDLIDRIRSHKADLVTRLVGVGHGERGDEPGESSPLSVEQERIWLHEHMSGGTATYNLPLSVRLSGPLCVVALAQAVAEVARRHDVLRTRYPARRGRPRQEVGSRLPETAVVDLAGLPAGRRDAVAMALTTAEALRPFRLSTDGGLRPVLLRAEPREHRLLLTRHHVSADGWSFGLLAGELGENYRAYRFGSPTGRAELLLQYADYARWQREPGPQTVQAGQVAGAERAASPATAPHGAALRPARVLRRELDAELTGRIRRVAAEAGTSVFTVLMATLAAAVGSVTGVDHVVVGTPSAGRYRPQWGPLIGTFAEVRTVRCDLSGRPRFAELLHRVHRALGAELAVDDRTVPRVDPDLGDQDVVLAHQAFPPFAVDLPGLQARLDDAVPVPAKFPLMVTATAHGDGYLSVVESDPDRVSGAVALAVADRFGALLRAGGERPAGSVPELLSTVEPPEIVDGPVMTAGAGDTLADAFRAAARQRPDAVALACGRVQLSYRGLNRLAARMAEELGADAGPETVVGVCAEPSIDLVVAIVGIELAGAAYLPLDPADPPIRHEQLLADAHVGVLVVDATTAHRFEWFEGRTVGVGADVGPGPRVLPRQPAVHPDALAYVLHTSGSTGPPKGVLVSHRNVTGMLAATTGAVDTSDRDVWSMAHPAAFDFSVWELWGALTRGARLVVLPAGSFRDPLLLWRTVVDQQVTVLSATPSAFTALCPVAVGAPPVSIALRVVVLGGERCRPAQMRTWLDTFGDEHPRLVTMFGITETTVHVTQYRITTDDAVAPGSPVGRAQPGMTAQVVDRQGVPTPPGGRGEVLVGGCGVSRGYLGRPGLTADRFRPDEHGSAGGRVYRSGDLVLVGTEGQLDYRGRRDRQVTVRGHRVELGEIEASLLDHEDVRAAAVVQLSEGDRSHLAGFVVPAPGAAPSVEDVREFLVERLPRHMVVDVLTVLDRFPLTRNGKVDHAALPREKELPRTVIAPRTPTERSLITMWAELLGTDPARISTSDGLLAHGGNSLLVTRLHARLADEFAVDLPMHQVYRVRDITALGAAVDAIRADSTGSDLSRLLPLVEAMSDDEVRRRTR